MKVIRNPLFRWGFVILFVAATFNGTPYSLLSLAIENLTRFPLLTVAMACLWTVPAVLVLPTSRRAFQVLTAVAMVGLYCIAAWYFTGIFGDPLATFVSNWALYVIPLVGLVLGWFPLATRVWRDWNVVVAVQDADHEGSH